MLARTWRPGGIGLGKGMLMGVKGCRKVVPVQIAWLCGGALTHGHAVLVAFDDVKGVTQVPFCDIKDDVGLVGGVQRCDGPQKDDLCSK